MVTANGETRPVFILRPDGGPDWNPRHQKNQAAFVKLFLDFDLDAVVIALHPEGLFIPIPEGHSAFNPVERKMAPLSRELVGVIFDHQHYDVHLNSKKETIDDELERRNFAYAGKALASLWDSMPKRGRAIGNYDVDAR